MSEIKQNGLTLNVAPVTFSDTEFTVGVLPYRSDEEYRTLRESHRVSHVFRYNNKTGNITNVGLAHDIQPIGNPTREPVREHLLLLGKAIQGSLLRWLLNINIVLRPSKPIMFWGKKRSAQLLGSVLDELGLAPEQGLEVVARHMIDTRILEAPAHVPAEFIGLLVNISTSNIIDIPVSTLIERGVNVVGLYVCRREALEDSDILPRLETIGKVSTIRNQELLLVDTDGTDCIASDAVVLEPRQENLERVIRALYTAQSDRILKRLNDLRKPFSTALGKLARVKDTLKSLRERHALHFSGGLTGTVGHFLTRNHAWFPPSIATSRPSFLFGAQGRSNGPQPDEGIRRFGPYKFMYNECNEPTIAVICEPSQRGRMEQFMASLRDGFPEDTWRAAMSWQGDRMPENPFRGGLVGKFRLGRVHFEYEILRDTGVTEYRAAINRIIHRLPELPALAIVQTRESYHLLFGDSNPYLVSKAAFMQAGIPVQAVEAETLEMADASMPYTLNNISLACYAKMNGVPWVISTRGPTSHEIVIGLGYTEIGDGKLGARKRFVGLTTMFQGDGRYLVWGQTREVEFEQYADALLDNLRSTISYVRNENNWQTGDHVRLIFHVYKPLKHREIDAIKALTRELISADYSVTFAFLDISHHHNFQLFEPSQEGASYSSSGSRNHSVKGAGIPTRGVSVQLNKTTALIQLSGPRDIKTDAQGAPQPLRIDLHPESDFDDLTYLVRQVYHFTYMSWRSFFPSSEPVTISYSRRIANKLGSMKSVSGWDSRVLAVGALRGSKWFL